MKFEYDKKQIQRIASEHSYTATNVEKVIRLCLILDDLNGLEEFAGKLLLKGGTAINLIAFDRLPRLSVILIWTLPITCQKKKPTFSEKK